MDGYGAVHVGPTSAPDLLATAVGRQLTDAAVLLDRKRHAAALAADLADQSLEPLLRRHLGCHISVVAAATALAAIGIPRGDLTDPVTTWIAHCADPDTIARVCRDTLDRTAIPRLRELADADQRATFTSEVSTKIWRDEAHRDAIRTAIAHLDNHI